MKKIFSLMLLFCVVLGTFSVPAAAEDDDTLVIDLSGDAAVFSLESGAEITDTAKKAFFLNKTDSSPVIQAYGDTQGWQIDNSTHGKLSFDLPDEFMNNLDGNRDVLVTVKYYDGDTDSKNAQLGLMYNSHNNHPKSTKTLTYESAGVVTLGKTAEWKEHTFTLERPYFRDVGNSPYLWNFILTVNEPYFPYSSPVTVSEVRVTYGEERDLFLNIDSDENGNIFFGTAPIKLNLNITNPKEIAFDLLTVKYVVKERIEGTEMFSGEQSFSVPASNNHTVTLDFSEMDLPFATYVAHVEVYNGNKLLATKQTEFSRVNGMSRAQVDSPVFNKSIYALNDHLTSYSDRAIDEGLELENRVGTKYVRMMIGYAGMEKNGEFMSFDDPDNPNGQKVLRYLKLAKEKGIKVLGIVGNDAHKYSTLHPYRQWEYQDGELVCTNEDKFQAYIDHFSAFCAHAVEELSEYVECWEITNEYNWGSTANYDGAEHIWHPQYGINNEIVKDNAVEEGSLLFPKEGTDEDKRAYNPVDLTEITIECSKAMKNVDPNAVIVSCALGGTSSTWLERMFKEGLLEHVDVISVHSYPENLEYLEEYEKSVSIGAAEKIRALISKYGGDQELWMTEYNYNTQKRIWYRTEKLQIETLLKFLIKNQFNNYYDRVYTYRMEGAYYESDYRYLASIPDDPYDVITTEFSAKLPYLATAFFNKLTATARPVELQSGTIYDSKKATVSHADKEDINYIAKYHDEALDAPVYAIFNYNDTSGTFTPRPREVTIDEPGRELVAYDMYGNIIGEGTDSITVTATSEIVYVTEKSDFTPVSDTLTENITVYGNATPNSKISAIVLKEDVGLDDIIAAPTAATFVDQLITDDEGQYSFTFGVSQGSGKYNIYITDEYGTRQVYDVTYNDGKFDITYRLSQNGGAVWDFKSIGDGNLTADFEIINPEKDKRITDYIVIGASYKDNTLVDASISSPGKLTADDEVKTGKVTISNIDKSEIDRIKFFLINDLEQLTPLTTVFELK